MSFIVKFCVTRHQFHVFQTFLHKVEELGKIVSTLISNYIPITRVQVRGMNVRHNWKPFCYKGNGYWKLNTSIL
jgi:hypothetical protein